MVRANEDSQDISVAEEILTVVPSAEVIGEDKKTIRFRLRGPLGSKIVVFCRKSLRRLASDIHRRAKIEYLQRDIKRSLQRASVYSYPRRLASGS